MQVLQKIRRYCRKYAENMQVLQKICRKYADIADFLQYLRIFCNTCIFSAHFLQYLRIFCNTCIFSAYFLKGGLLVLDDLMVEGGEDNELLDLFTKHSHHQNITVLYLCQDMFPPRKYAKCISRNAHYIKNPRDQLGMKNLLLQAFPTCWQDMMDVYQKVTERPFGYTVLDLHPASDNRKRVFSHLLTHEGYPRWHRRIKKEGV